MTLDLPSYYQHLVIDGMARAILSEVRSQRLCRIGSMPASSRIELQELRAIIRSVPPGLDRRMFIVWLRHRFQTLRSEQGLAIRSTQFYAAVEEFNRTRP